MHHTATPHIATAIALVGAGIIATTPMTAPPPPDLHPMKIATVQDVELTSLSSALVGVIEGLRTTVDTGAASVETGLEQTWSTQYLAVKGLIADGQSINTAITTAVESAAGAIPVVGPVLVTVIDTPRSVVPQGLATLDVVYRIGTQLAFGAVEFVPLEAANVTDVVAKTVIGLLNAVPAPLAVASTTSAPLKTTAASSVGSNTGTETTPVAKPGTRAAKAVSAAATAANKAFSHAVSSALSGLHPPKKKKSAATNTVTTASPSDTSGDTKSSDGADNTGSSK
ncbi:hypothetical protein [Mycobacterium sp. OAE908]|uniref:hypothetical protein n=1 Tax=Mycobacterium sp. OAE908 TaxID=2817899 RepID=UPI001AE25925